jgi:hypothetical protein
MTCLNILNLHTILTSSFGVIWTRYILFTSRYILLT